MRCPRCMLVDIPEGARTCVLCGYSAHIQAPATGRARAAAAGATDPLGSAVLLEEAPTELDARRELAAEFRIEGLLRGAPEPIVYLVWDGDDQPLTLKAVQSEPLGPVADRFSHAAEAATKLEHSHIVPVHRFGATDHFLWYAMKRIDGRSLESILGTIGSLELSACVRILEQVASALDHAHRRGAAHGGLKSEHVFVAANEWVQVSDFVLAGLLEPPADEQRAKEPPLRADQYALAALAYECLTGTPAYDGPPLARRIEERGDIPLHVAQALRRALSPRPAERFPTVLDFVAALGAPTAAASTPWFGAAPKRKLGAPMVIVADDEDQEEDVERPSRPPVRRRGRLVAAASAVLVLASGVVWLNTPSVPASPTHPNAGLRTPPQEPDTQWASLSADSLPSAAPQPAPPAHKQPAAPPRAAPTPVKRALPPPAVARRTTPTAPPQAARRTIARPAEPALLSINAVPWGSVLIDGEPVGNTPQIDLHLVPGAHRLRVERDGFRPFEREIVLAPGQKLRITDIALVER